MNKILYALALVAGALLLSGSSCQKENPDSDNKEQKTSRENPSGQESLEGKKILVCGNSMIYYGGLVQYGNQKSSDQGMLFEMIRAGGEKATVIDCTYGGHHLCDFSAAGCKYTDAHGEDGKKASSGCPGIGTDLLGGIKLKEIDILVISEAGNNYDHFYNDAVTLFKRVKDANPQARLFYVNHIYSVFKKHGNVLNNLKTLHDNLDVTIVNCGQLACDIYEGRVKVPGSSVSYKDKYTFVNHTDSDSHHPNPLMGYIMTRMVYLAIKGDCPADNQYLTLVRNSKYAGGSVSYDAYYGKYYTTGAALPFMNVLENSTEMKGIQELLPKYINKY